VRAFGEVAGQQGEDSRMEMRACDWACEHIVLCRVSI
jgi:hypothetical protein